jgi:transient receptor potential cation channel subfamily A protein 1
MASFKQSQCLAHPLCVAFVNAKWKRFVAFVSIGNLLSYFIYVLLLSWVVLTYPTYNPMLFLTDEPSIRKAMIHLQLKEKENKTDISFEEIFKFCYDHPLRWAIVASAFTGILKELIPILYQGVTYLKRLSALIEIVVYILTLLSMDPFIVLLDKLEFDPPCPLYYWEIGAMAIFLSWLNLLLHSRRLPRIGLYIVMIVSMVQTMLKLLVVVALFVAAFASAFYMLMSKNEAMSFKGFLFKV